MNHLRLSLAHLGPPHPQCLPTKCGIGSSPLLSLGGVRFLRYRITARGSNIYEGGIQYPGFKYFPRPGEVDPPHVPTKLFMVRRIRSTKGKPWWDKKIIKTLGIEDRAEIAIVKNTPANNSMLYKVKHLIEVIPITVPYGMPEDPKHGFLKDNGEFVSYDSLEGHKMEIEQAKSKWNEVMKKSLDGPTLKRRLHLAWYNRNDIQ